MYTQPKLKQKNKQNVILQKNTVYASVMFIISLNRFHYTKSLHHTFSLINYARISDSEFVLICSMRLRLESNIQKFKNRSLHFEEKIKYNEQKLSRNSASIIQNSGKTYWRRSIFEYFRVWPGNRDSQELYFVAFREIRSL